MGWPTGVHLVPSNFEEVEENDLLDRFVMPLTQSQDSRRSMYQSVCETAPQSIVVMEVVTSVHVGRRTGIMQGKHVSPL